MELKAFASQLCNKCWQDAHIFRSDAGQDTHFSTMSLCLPVPLAPVLVIFQDGRPTVNFFLPYIIGWMSTINIYTPLN